MLKDMYKENTYIPLIDQSNFDQARQNSEYINLSKCEINQLENWFKYDGVFYFLKDVDDLNEFIGEYIARKIKLKSAHYIPVIKDGNVLVASENFRKMNCTYFNAGDLPKKIPLVELLDNPAYSDIKKNLFKLFSLDIYMLQKDRSIPNILFQIDTTGKLTLAPIYDYSNFFNCCSYNMYDNSILEIPMDKVKFNIIMNKYPELYNYIINILDIELEEILNEICDDFDFKLIDECKSYYLTRETNMKNLIKKII